MVNLKGSIFGGVASSGTNPDSTSLQFAKREGVIDVKYEFIASAMSLCPVSSLLSTINLPISQFTFTESLFETFPKITWVWSTPL